jgi:Spy/CpxP family protein refolding chaperone
MKMKIFTYAVSILLVVNLTALGVMAYHRFFETVDASPCGKPGKGFERVKRELSLSPEQEKNLLEYRKACHSIIDSLSTPLQEERRLLVDELKQEDPDLDRLIEIVERINLLQLKAQTKIVEHLLEVKNVLEPEQQGKFFKIVMERFGMEVEQEEDRYPWPKKARPSGTKGDG